MFLFYLALAMMPASCSESERSETSGNPHAYVTSGDKVRMITTLKEIEKDCLYEMDYTTDYKLDELIESDVRNMSDLLDFIATEILDVVPTGNPTPGLSSGCSAYAAIESSMGDLLMGRNYDYCHVEKGVEVPISAILVRTAPKGGKKSISMVDSYWMGYRKGFYKDGISDLSMLMAAPYEILDGVNEDGFAVCILHLDGKATCQDDAKKKSLWSSIVMRKLIDNASTVTEAIEMLGRYNVTMESPASGNFHFFVTDATGDYAIVEYSYKDAASVDTTLPNIMKVFRGKDCDRYVTNFYVDPDLSNHPTLGPLGKHGLWRYDSLRVNLERNLYTLGNETAMNLLKTVSQSSNPKENTSHTQWSALYNLTQRKVDIAILQQYERVHTFRVE